MSISTSRRSGPRWLSSRPPSLPTLPWFTAVAWLCCMAVANAQTFLTVNSYADVNDDNLTDGICATATGACTLRAALQHANAVGGTFVITLPAGTYGLTLPGGGENACVVGDLDIFAASVTLRCLTGTATIDGNLMDRCLDIHNGVAVALENITFTNGNPGAGTAPGTTSAHGGGLRINGLGGGFATVTASECTFTNNIADLPGGAVTHGGGVYSAGNLTLSDCVVVSNSAKYNGGGLFAAGGSTTTVVDTQVLENTAERGGGIGNGGSMTLTRVNVIGNSSTSSGGGIRNTGGIGLGECLIEGNQGGLSSFAFGGGVHNEGGATMEDTTIRLNAHGGSGGGWANGNFATLDAQRSTISGNSASADGGGMNVLGTVVMTNCTVSHNDAGVNGGGFSTFATATTNLVNVTVAHNTSAGGGGVQSTVSAPGFFEMHNSILEGNTPNNCGGTTPIVATGVVLDSDGTGSFSAPHLSGVSALLGPLQNNGGLTETHELLAGSPAIDAGLPAACSDPTGLALLEDQRGFPRPEDGNGDGVDECDLGSFEAPAGSPSGCMVTGWNLIPTPTSPGPRLQHAMAFDSARGKTVLYGGEVAGQGTWEYDGTWQQVFTPGIGDRYGHAMAYDSARGVTVLFGGRDNFGIFNQTWEWNGVSWTQRSLATSPPARMFFTMAYDSARGVTVLFGGRTLAGAFFGDTWEYDGNNWVQRFPANSPSPREGATLAYDSARGVTVLYAGSMGSVYQDTWEWNGTNWILRLGSSPPGPKTLHASVFEDLQDTVLVYGGGFSGDEVWRWDGSSWSLLTPGTGPGTRSFMAMAFDSTRGVPVLYGGNGSGVTYSDTWEIGCATSGAPNFIRGDVNNDLTLSIGDPIFLLSALFTGGAAPSCADAADANDDGLSNLGDVITILQHLFQGTGPLPPPNTCGPDPTPDTIRCASHLCP